MKEKYKTKSNISSLLSLNVQTLDNYSRFILLLDGFNDGHIGEILPGEIIWEYQYDARLNICHYNILSVFVEFLNELLIPSSLPMSCSAK